MKATELRIGNLVDCYSDSNAFPIKAHSILALDLVDMWSEEMEKKGIEVRGIPLSEEWLHKFGLFESFEFAKVFTVWLGKDGDVTIEQYHEGEFPLPHIKYVHQLQNLYFALTGNELSITPTK